MLYLKTPTFIQIHRWVNENISSEIPIAYIGGRYQTFTPNGSAVGYMRSINSNFKLNMTESIVGSNNTRNIVYVRNLPGNKFEKLKNLKATYSVKFVIDYYQNPGDSLYRFNPEFFKIIKSFNPVCSKKPITVPEPLFDPSYSFKIGYITADTNMYGLCRFGPHFDILEVRDSI